MTLRKPPTRTSSRLLGNLLTLVILLALAGLAIWAAVTNQRVDLVESTRFRDLEHVRPVEVGELTVSLTIDRQGEPTVVLLHDADIAGSIVWDQLAAAVPESYGVARIDLPGFGLSSRMPEPGPGHTVAEMAAVVSEVLTAEFAQPVVLTGVGLGGKVAAEVAVITPELTTSVVLVDVDFWDTDDWVEIIKGLPWIGRAFTYTFETGGQFALERWAPHCVQGGWCPSPEQIEARAFRAEIEESTDSVYGFVRTARASQVPSRLDQVAVPVVFVHSTQGEVPAESVERLIEEELPELIVVEVETFQAHLETPDQIAVAIGTAAGQ
jgi:pimeloyl-ACP methyl ester carboxylesterase